MSASTFDRVRPRTPAADPQPMPPERPTRRSARTAAPGQVDLAGKAALFSEPVTPPTLGQVAITCSACQIRSVVTYWAALRLAIPSLHLPVLHRPDNWWLRCPACQRRTWVRLAVGTKP